MPGGDQYFMPCEGLFVGHAILRELTELGKIGIVLELYGLKFVVVPVVHTPIIEFYEGAII
jgi:hypothetical protein